MRQKIKIDVPRRLGLIMQDPHLDNITLSVDHYDIILNLTESPALEVPDNQWIQVHPKD